MAYKMAIIGFGGMGNGHFTDISRRIKSIRVKGAYDVRPEACENIVSKGMKLYKNPQEIYDDKKLDLVLIATQNDVHMPYAIACLESGKNVVCEKPATLNLKELEKIYSAAEKSGKFFTIHQNRRWDTDFLTVKKIIDEKMLNNPFNIVSRVRGARKYLNNWRSYKVNGGGMIYDWGVHLVDQMLMLIPSKVVSVFVQAHSIYSKEVEDNFSASFRFENGLVYQIEVTNHLFMPPPRWMVYFEDGTVIIDDINSDGRIIKLSDKEEQQTVEEIVYMHGEIIRNKALRLKEMTVELPLPEITKPTDFHTNIAEVLAGKAEIVIKKEQALRAMRVLDLMYESMRTGSSVKCCV